MKTTFMLARELLSNTVLPLRTSDTALTALRWMEEYKVSHLPIVNNNELLGLISEADIFTLNKYEEPLGNHELSLRKQFVTQHQHIYEVIRLVSEQKLTLLPVVDDKNHFLGCIALPELVNYFARLSAVDNPGGIIVLETGLRDYSLSEIAQIVESNNAQILSLYIRTPENSTKIEITLKLNTINIQPVLQTFERYNYSVTASFHHEEDNDNLMRDRYDALMKYLNI